MWPDRPLLLLHMVPGPAVAAFFHPSSSFMKVATQNPLQKQVPICPVTTCSPCLLPTSSLTCFLSPVSQKDAGCCAVQLRGSPCTETVLVPRHSAVSVQWPTRGRNLFVLLPCKDCQLLDYRKQDKTNKQKGLLCLMVHHKT